MGGGGIWSWDWWAQHVLDVALLLLGCRRLPRLCCRVSDVCISDVDVGGVLNQRGDGLLA